MSHPVKNFWPRYDGRLPVLPAKLKQLLLAILFLTALRGQSQSFRVKYKAPGSDSFFRSPGLLKDSFSSKEEADIYFVQLPSLLRGQGYLAASVDSVLNDSSSTIVVLFLGEQYRWTKLATNPKDEALLQSVRWQPISGNMDLGSLQQWQQRLLNHLEENGHPFGKVYLDSIGIEGGEVSARLNIDPGPVYKIDSIRVYGDARVSNEFLQRWLGIYNGSIYSSKKIREVPRRLAELQFLEMENNPIVDYLGTGSVLNLYLKGKRNSQVNALVGFLPNSNRADGQRKFLLTVDANILLRNALGSGETIGLVWQQLQAGSPRLNLVFDQPFIFRSAFGLNFSLDMYKRDSSFLNINMNLGTSYRIEEKQTASIFIQRRQSIVSGINEAAVLSSRRLPREADVSSVNLGVGYNFNNTDYRFNPRKGNELSITTSAGTKKIRKNSQITDLQDPSDPGFKFESLYDTVKLKAYQFRVAASGAHFVPLGGQSTLKLGASAGIYQSANYFRNELFQIGGFRLLRGFDEESQFVSQYGIGTVEYRLRTDVNSYFFAFVDGGFGKHLLDAQKNHNYIGTGVGLSLQLKTSIVNMAVALGRRDDAPFNLRQPKVHLGFASYF